MNKIDQQEFLNKPEILQEIRNHLWIESQKAGHDLGFDFAAKDWIEKYSAKWLVSHMAQKAEKCQESKKEKILKKKK